VWKKAAGDGGVIPYSNVAATFTGHTINVASPLGGSCAGTMSFNASGQVLWDGIARGTLTTFAYNCVDSGGLGYSVRINSINTVGATLTYTRGSISTNSVWYWTT